MNPLDLPGPEFLRFYLAYGLIALAGAVGVKLLLQQLVPGPTPAVNRRLYPKESDAYRLALLRGGRDELVRTVLARFSAEELVILGDDVITKAKRADRATAALEEIEAAALQAVPGSGPARDAFTAVRRVLEPHAAKLEADLRREGLLRSSEARAPFTLLFAVGLLVVCGMGVAKLVVAIAAGRRNVWYLIFMTAAFALIAVLALKPPRVTQAGRQLLAWLRDSHAGLKALITAGRRTGSRELALATAIYGLGALAAVPALGTLRRSLRPQGSTSNWSSSCGSGCGSSGGCGGGCGGGGCGGCGG
jgi:uncharacterized protein (TIGR04222 family)